MVRNKYFLAGLGGLLLLVLIYNIAFFSGRGKGGGRPSTAPGTAEPVDTGGASRAAAQPRESGMAGEWRRDPFWYPGGRPHAAQPSGRRAAGLHLEATMAEGGKAYAIINSEIVGIGERFNGHLVEEIGDQFVKLKGPGGTKTLFIAGDLIEKEHHHAQ